VLCIRGSVLDQHADGRHRDELHASREGERFGERNTDAQTRAVAIEAGGKLIKSTVYGSEKEPVELSILLNRSLQQLIK